MRSRIGIGRSHSIPFSVLGPSLPYSPLRLKLQVSITVFQCSILSREVTSVSTYSYIFTLMVCGLTLLSGCNGSNATTKSSAVNLKPVPVVNASEFYELVQSSEEPVLVEFSVMTGCFRCNDMRPQVQQLRDDLRGRVEIVRMDFHSNQTLAASLGATVCPSYVLFSNGQPLWAQNYPSSGGLLSSKVSQQLTDNSQSPSENRSEEDSTSF
ncbi:thioredoxin family protein [Gimesia maris]|uniref:thioredoxin family protein n=1 Tax=Gimesia maris TaxID=122 RepID=UPI0032EF0F43